MKGAYPGSGTLGFKPYLGSSVATGNFEVHFSFHKPRGLNKTVQVEGQLTP